VYVVQLTDTAPASLPSCGDVTFAGEDPSWKYGDPVKVLGPSGEELGTMGGAALWGRAEAARLDIVMIDTTRGVPACKLFDSKIVRPPARKQGMAE
jgi:hypothetical protein